MAKYEEIAGRWGRVRFLKDDQFVGKSLAHYGEYGPDETEYLLSLVGKDDGVVLDIGANIGTIAQAFASKGYEVICFEPQKVLADLCLWNVSQVSRTANVVQTALGNENGTAHMPKQMYHKSGNFGGVSLSEEGVPVALAKLDTLCSRGMLFSPDKRISLMKIDVEGHEEEVLRGAAETIATHRPILYVEADRQEKLAALSKFIISLGYVIEQHNPTLFRAENFFKKRKNIWPINYRSYNWVCRPL